MESRDDRKGMGVAGAPLSNPVARLGTLVQRAKLPGTGLHTCRQCCSRRVISRLAIRFSRTPIRAASRQVQNSKRAQLSS